MLSLMDETERQLQIGDMVTLNDEHHWKSGKASGTYRIVDIIEPNQLPPWIAQSLNGRRWCALLPLDWPSRTAGLVRAVDTALKVVDWEAEFDLGEEE